MAEKKLTLKQEAFVQAYLTNGHNGTAAYKKAYPRSTDNTARNEASKLLANPCIQKRVKDYQAKAEKRTQITQDRVIMELARVAFADIGLIAAWDEDGNMTLKPASELTPEQTAAIQSIQANDHFYQGEKIGTRVTYKMHDKLKALELLCKHLGILDGSGNGSGSDSSDVTQRLRRTLGALVGK